MLVDHFELYKGGALSITGCKDTGARIFEDLLTRVTIKKLFHSCFFIFEDIFEFFSRCSIIIFLK